jgi:hypothetical protein
MAHSSEPPHSPKFFPLFLPGPPARAVAFPAATTHLGPMAPDTPVPAPTEDDAAERLALEAAVAEARASGPGIPHEVARERLLGMIAEARERIAALQKAAEEQAREA